MNITLLHNQLGICDDFRLKRLVSSLRGFGHDVICVDISNKEHALRVLKKRTTDAVYGYKLCCVDVLRSFTDQVPSLLQAEVKCECDACIDATLVRHYEKHRERLAENNHQEENSCRGVSIMS